MNPWIAIVGLVVAMVAAIATTMVVENWRHLVQPVPRRPARPDATDVHTDPAIATRGTALAPAAAAVTATTTSIAAGQAPTAPAPPVSTRPRADRPDPDRPPDPEDRRAPEAGPPAGDPVGALVVDGTRVVVRDHATVDVLAGLLFAGYAVGRRSGADRAAAWVTASATPPSADPTRFAPGVRLRGRPSQVAELLAADDDGRVWVDLQHDVDIARGLARSPVTQPTLAALVEWWRVTRELPSSIDAEAAGRIAEAVAAVRSELDRTPWSDVVERLQVALSTAGAAGAPLRVTVGQADEPPPAPAVVSAAPTRAVQTS